MTFKIYRYTDIDGNDIFKLVQKFKFDFSSIKNFFMTIGDRLIGGPITYSGGGDYPNWWNGREPFISTYTGRLDKSEYPLIVDLDNALEICSKHYITTEKEKLVNKKIKLFMKPVEVQIIKGKAIITGDKK